MISTKEIGVSIITAPRIIRSSIVIRGYAELGTSLDILVPAVVEYRLLVEGHRIEVAVECHLQNRG